SGSTELTIGVKRVQCASGVTGEVLAPVVTYEEARIVISVDVEPLADGAFTCQGNPTVPVQVRLTEPIGHRELVDGGCDDPRAARLIMCEDPVRWSPPG